LFIAGGLVFLHWFFILRHTETIAPRGGVQPSLSSLLSEGIPRIMRGIQWVSFNLFGVSGYRSAGALGLESVWSHPLAVLLVPLLALGVMLVVVLASRRQAEPSFNTRRTLVLFAAGCIWFASAFVPAAMIRGQIVESRMLYLAWAGLAFMFGAGIELVVKKLPRRWSYVVALAMGSLFFALILLMAGFGRLYQLRSEHDQRQLQALSKAVPRIPDSGAFLIPIHMDEGFVTAVVPEGENLEQALLGVFEAVWSAGSSVRMLYGVPYVSPVTSSRWSDYDIGGIEGQGNDTALLINGRSLATALCLAFSYQNGEVILYDWLLVKWPDGRQERVDLPLARQAGAPGVTYRELVLEVSKE
jgi:hypothetical protein